MALMKDHPAATLQRSIHSWMYLPGVVNIWRASVHEVMVLRKAERRGVVCIYIMLDNKEMEIPPDWNEQNLSTSNRFRSEVETQQSVAWNNAARCGRV